MIGGAGEKGEQKDKSLLFCVPVFQSHVSDEAVTTIYNSFDDHLISVLAKATHGQPNSKF